MFVFFIILECVNDLYASRCTVRYQLSQYCTTLLLVMKKKKKHRVHREYNSIKHSKLKINLSKRKQYTGMYFHE